MQYKTTLCPKARSRLSEAYRFQFDYEKFTDVQADQKFLESKRAAATAPNGVVSQDSQDKAARDKERDPDEQRESSSDILNMAALPESISVALQLPVQCPPSQHISSLTCLRRFFFCQQCLASFKATALCGNPSWTLLSRVGVDCTVARSRERVSATGEAVGLMSQCHVMPVSLEVAALHGGKSQYPLLNLAGKHLRQVPT